MITRAKAFTFITALCLLLVASAAWACTAQTYLHPISPAAVPTREKVTVQGTLDRHGPVPADLRWDSADGPVLGSFTAEGEKPFSIEVTVPEVPPGVYYLVLTPTDNTAGVARAAIEVLPPPSRSTNDSGSASSRVKAASNDLWGGFASSPGQLHASDATPLSEGGPTAGVGMALVGVGALALLTGLSLGVTKRKKTSLSIRKR